MPRNPADRPATEPHSWENHDDSCWCHITICQDCGCTNEIVPAEAEGAAPRAEGPGPVRSLEEELTRMERTYPRIEAACPECGHDADHTTACPGGCPLCAAPRAEGLDTVVEIVKRHTHQGRWAMTRFAGESPEEDCLLCRALVAAGVLSLDEIGAGTREAISRPSDEPPVCPQCGRPDCLGDSD